MIEHYSKRDKHEHEPGDPRATSRQGFVQCQKQDIESTYHGILLMKTPCCHHGNSSHFFHFFIEQDARTFTNSKTRYELRKELTLGYSHTSPTLGVCKTSSVWSSCLLLQLFLHQDISKCCSRCSLHVRRCCLSIILLDLPLERLATKITRRKTISQNMLLLLLKGK